MLFYSSIYYCTTLNIWMDAPEKLMENQSVTDYVLKRTLFLFQLIHMFIDYVLRNIYVVYRIR
jgi:hypothetical protein